VSSWRIYRKLSSQSTYSLYSEENIDNNLIFRDLQANINENIYDYRVEVIDVCDRITDLSNRGRNILLETNKGENSNDLSFNYYQDWANGVASYEIYFSTDSIIDNSDQIGIIGNLENTFSHTPFIEDTIEIYQCYYVRAISNPVGSEIDTSISNLSCEFEEAIVYLPNAIRIEGRNRIFKPVGLNYLRDRGSLMIYNRWGQEIFSSDNPEEGWDGTFNGNGDYVDEGLYLYFISLEGTDGNTYYFNGEINVIK
jgi:hypothetical protein